MEPFRVLDHEADIYIEIYGASREELFRNAARALFSMITDLTRVRPETERTIRIDVDGELLINYLNELLYIWDVERFMPSDVSVVFEETGLTATIKGEHFDEARHGIDGELKAVTYHKFSLVEEQGTFKATIVVDV